MARPGELRDRVTIQQRAESADGQGGRAVTWSTFATVWASVVAQSAAERFEAGAIGSVARYEIEIRYRADVTPKMRVSWTPYQGSAKTLQIHGVVPRGGARARLVLECSEAV